MPATIRNPRRLAATAIFALLLMATLAAYGRLTAPVTSKVGATRVALPIIVCASQQANPDLPPIPRHPH
ncbi:MAG TPA: hypothetical protein VH591_18985 [Ktedonobacterales bacterium]|jgi:hypothetical protein